MRVYILALIIVILGGTFANPRRGGRGDKRPTPTEAPNPEPPVPTEAPEPPAPEPTESPVDDDDSSNDGADDTNGGDSAYATVVKALIDAGSCADVSYSNVCGDSSTSSAYYETFEYAGWRVVISSGVPKHAAETDLLLPNGRLNPNRRCVAWQYALLPLNPTKGNSFTISNMGTVGWISSGGVIYNHLSNPDGSLAAYEEIESLDSCGGHSDPSKQYHYHLIPYCWEKANDANACQMLGYMKDGFPVYGRCRHTDGSELVSCWTQKSGTVGADYDDFEFDSEGYASGQCHLDESNGYNFPDGSYGYVLTDNIFQTPIGYYGNEWRTAQECGFTP